jgi:rfaE bifunctional protein nucleotidyltransferase chain/domain
MKIVACGGCFDILHAGHVKLLEEAKKLGDLLVVLVNDDTYVARKGPQRPILRLPERMAVLRALRAVDVVLSFSDETPCRMLELIEADVFVKYIEYEGKDIPEEATMRKLGGKVVYIDSGITTHTTDLVAALQRPVDAICERPGRYGRTDG